MDLQTTLTKAQLMEAALLSDAGLTETYRGFTLVLRLADNLDLDVEFDIFGRKLFDQVIPETALDSAVCSLITLALGGHSLVLLDAFEFAVGVVKARVAGDRKNLHPAKTGDLKDAKPAKT